MQSLAQDCLDRGLPTGVDAQLVPELGCGCEAVPLQPFAQRGVVLGLGLDLAQRGKLRLRRGMLTLGDAHGFGRLRARFL